MQFAFAALAIKVKLLIWNPLLTDNPITLPAAINYVTITGNYIETINGTDSGISLEVDGSGAIDSVAITGNTIKCDAGNYVNITGSPTNVVKSGNNEV
ncbi:unnamed protein product [marine sediment metagenome]|uniref:Uncharacterized protein n=1 Tax=marine sediment metagenome TaxID=412755 RepID=X1CL62_9ZZZZ